MNLSPSVQLAQDRLREFRNRYEPTWTELAQVIGLNVKRLKDLLKQKAGPNPYAQTVMDALGSEVYDVTCDKLDALRDHSANAIEKHTARGVTNSSCRVASEPADKSKPGFDSTERIAIKKRLTDVRTNGDLTLDQMIACMNLAPMNRVFKKNALSVALAPSSLDTLSDEYLKDIADAVSWVESSKDDRKCFRSHESSTGTKSIPVPAAKTETETTFPSEGAIREWSKAYLQDLLGVTENDLYAMKPAIEMLLVAKRNGVPARVVIDDVVIMA